jgi:hypothetical protein
MMNSKNKSFNKVAGDNSNSSPESDVYKSERRNSKRFDERLHAKLDNEWCAVLNVSAKGVLLQTPIPDYFFPIDKSIEFDLQLEDGQWVSMRATVMWVQCDQLNAKIGLFIQYAPEPYFQFLRQLYE